ncbi:hypothetical protein [Burkholderia sp. PU8-34]
MTKSVPQHYVGVWQRAKLRRGTSPLDVTTRVFWLQTPRWHADIRVPADRVDFARVASIGECDDRQLDALLQQEAFCGITSVDGDVCRWHRQIDYRLRETDDFGRMAFEGDRAEEFGIATDYYELWHRLPDSAGPSIALERIDFADGAFRRAFLCIAGDYFIYARDRALGTSPAVRTRSKIALGTATRAEIEAFVDFESSFGKIVSGAGTITLSTLPWREGAIAFEIESLAVAVGGTHARESGWRPIEGSGVYPSAGCALAEWR